MMLSSLSGELRMRVSSMDRNTEQESETRTLFPELRMLDRICATDNRACFAKVRANNAIGLRL